MKVNAVILDAVCNQGAPFFVIFVFLGKKNKNTIIDIDSDNILNNINFFIPIIRGIENYCFNNNYEFLSTLPHPEKIEMLINPVCQPNCDRRALHYHNISKMMLKQSFSDNLECPYAGLIFSEVQKSPLFISIEDIKEATTLSQSAILKNAKKSVDNEHQSDYIKRTRRGVEQLGSSSGS